MASPSESRRQRPVVLCILDGWGYREDPQDNAVAQARTPVFDSLWNGFPHALMEASQKDVGLPTGQIGNSEVGHTNLGAGRVIFQDLPMIDRAIETGEFDANPELQTFISKLKASGGTAHLMGLASPGGVHAHQDHMVALARVLSKAGIPVAVHCFLDGRDVPPTSARDQVAKFCADISGLPGVRVATVIGRFYAMDRDKRWDRVEKAFRAMQSAEGERANDPVKAIEASYAAKVTDEFVLPTVIDGYKGMKDGDGVLMANFRSDRAREILSAFLDPAFDGFIRSGQLKFAAMLGMVEYSERHNALMRTMFPPKDIKNGLGEVVAKAGLKQLRIAETEKYPHVTFFFNGGVETPYPNEERILVPSPKVTTYDLQPEMSAAELTDKLVAAIDKGDLDLVILNYANPDMVGHTGDLQAAIKAVEAVDQGLGRVLEAVRRQGGCMLVTADHGNCEVMRDAETGQPHTAHTLNPVPVVLVDGPASVKLRNGRLADVAPTLLSLLGLSKPVEMTGESLIVSETAAHCAAE